MNTKLDLFQSLLFCCLLFTVSWHVQAAKPAIAITEASLSGQSLSILGKVKNHAATNVDVYDSSGRLLGQPELDDSNRFGV